MEIPIDPNQILTAALVIMPIVFGLVEFIKDSLGLSGQIVRVVSFVTGFLLEAIFLIATLLPPPYSTITLGFMACLTIGLAASGYYGFVNQRLPRAETPQ